MKRVIYLSAIVILVLSGCKTRESFTVNGIIKGEKKEYIRISRLDVNTPVFIDSVKVGKTGKFRFKVDATEPDFYQVGFSSANFITLLAQPGETINIIFNGKRLFDDYNVEGSDGTRKIQNLDIDMASTKRKLDSLEVLFNKEKSKPDFETRGRELQDLYKNIYDQQRNKNISFILENTTSFASIKALYQKINDQEYLLNEMKDLQLLKIVSDSLSKYYPNSKQVQALSTDLKNGINRMNSERLRTLFMNMPETELNPDLKNVDGKKISLKSLRGKYVLLTFWSVTSSECIQENIQLRELYSKYHNKGFEIYQINVDPEESAWISSVKFDELPWISVREDDTEKLPVASLFNVSAVPANYLFDREGKIISTNLHGRSLQIKLGQLFN